MAEDWFYARNNQQMGPISAESLQDMVRRGELQPQDLLWRQGMAEWRPAVQVIDFAQLGGHSPATSPVPPIPQSESANPFAAPQSDIAPDVYTTGQSVFLGYAGFWKRVAAFIIDTILLNIVNTVITIPFGFIAFAADDADMAVGLQAISVIVSIIVAWLYESLMESSALQATVGKMALGIIVTDMFGRRISFARATGRHFAKILSALTLLVGFAMAGFTARKQALHDMVAGTLVINRR